MTGMPGSASSRGAVALRHVVRLGAALGLTAFLCVSWAAADVSDRQRAEIDHLLGFIGHSSCAFVRNGRSYGSERALRHVERKYDYFRDDIASTEDFIELAATRSTMSGKPYLFVCNGESRESQAVLLAELGRFRATVR